MHRLAPGGVVLFPVATCAACPLRERCTTSAHGRNVTIHPDERLLWELRQRQLTPLGRAKLRERIVVEHGLGHIGQWQGRRARYRGVRKNLFDLRRYAVVQNLHVIARLPALLKAPKFLTGVLAIQTTIRYSHPMREKLGLLRRYDPLFLHESVPAIGHNHHMAKRKTPDAKWRGNERAGSFSLGPLLTFSKEGSPNGPFSQKSLYRLGV